MLNASTRPLIFSALLGASACSPSAPPPPAPHIVKLGELCQGGDVDACGLLAQADANDRAARAAAVQAMDFSSPLRPIPSAQPVVAGAPVLQPAQMLPPPPSVMPGTQVTRCIPTAGGGVNCYQ